AVFRRLLEAQAAAVAGRAIARLSATVVARLPNQSDGGTDAVGAARAEIVAEIDPFRPDLHAPLRREAIGADGVHGIGVAVGPAPHPVGGAERRGPVLGELMRIGASEDPRRRVGAELIAQGGVVLGRKV